jgi:hypothetical protein
MGKGLIALLAAFALGGATALIAPKINTSLEQKVSQVSINNSNETDHSSKEIASEVKNTSQQKSSLITLT